MDSFGFSDEQKEKILSRSKPDAEDFTILSENWPALEIFLVCQTQWRNSPSGVTGLDYISVINVIALYHKKRNKRIFNQVRLIEFGAMTAIRKLKRN